MSFDVMILAESSSTFLRKLMFIQGAVKHFDLLSEAYWSFIPSHNFFTNAKFFKKAVCITNTKIVLP